MADWSTPGVLSTYVNVISDFKARDVDAISLAESPTNPPTGAIRYNRSANKFQEWSGSAWVDKVLSLAAGGTGAATAGDARTNLGLGTMATQNSNAVSITGGILSGLTSLGVSGNITIGGLLIAGSTPTTLTDTAGRILEASIADANILARVAGNETITGTWSFSNSITGNLNGNATTVSNGVYTNIAQTLTARKIFQGNQAGVIANATTNLGGIEIQGGLVPGDAAYLAFHRPTGYAVYFGLDGNDLKVGGWSMGAVSHTMLHSGNYNSYAPALNGTGATGTWGIGISGNAATAAALQTARTINGTSFNGTANITVTADASTLTGTSLAPGVTGSSLTSFGSGAQIELGDGSAATPSLRFANALNSGAYLNTDGGTVEFGARFDNADRSVMRAYVAQDKVDFLLGAVTVLNIESDRVLLPASGVPLQVNGNITSISTNTHDLGGSSNRFRNIYLTNAPDVTSDIRLKQVIGNIDNALGMVLKVNPFVFDWKDSEKPWARPGFSAQEIEEHIDAQLGTHIVHTDIMDIKSLTQENLIPILWQATKDLAMGLAILKREINGIVQANGQG